MLLNASAKSRSGEFRRSAFIAGETKTVSSVAPR